MARSLLFHNVIAKAVDRFDVHALPLSPLVSPGRGVQFARQDSEFDKENDVFLMLNTPRETPTVDHHLGDSQQFACGALAHFDDCSEPTLSPSNSSTTTILLPDNVLQEITNNVSENHENEEMTPRAAPRRRPCSGIIKSCQTGDENKKTSVEAEASSPIKSKPKGEKESKSTQDGKPEKESEMKSTQDGKPEMKSKQEGNSENENNGHIQWTPPEIEDSHNQWRASAYWPQYFEAYQAARKNYSSEKRSSSTPTTVKKSRPTNPYGDRFHLLAKEESSLNRDQLNVLHGLAEIYPKINPQGPVHRQTEWEKKSLQQKIENKVLYTKEDDKQQQQLYQNQGRDQGRRQEDKKLMRDRAFLDARLPKRRASSAPHSRTRLCYPSMAPGSAEEITEQRETMLPKPYMQPRTPWRP